MDEKHFNICQTCLSCDRLLFPLEKFETLLNDFNITIYNDNQEIKICWECKAVIRKLSKFRTQVVEAQRILSTYPLETISTLSSLKQTINYETDITCQESNTELVIKKEENDDKISFDDVSLTENNDNNDASFIKNNDNIDASYVGNDENDTLFIKNDALIIGNNDNNDVFIIGNNDNNDESFIGNNDNVDALITENNDDDDASIIENNDDDASFVGVNDNNDALLIENINDNDKVKDLKVKKETDDTKDNVVKEIDKYDKYKDKIRTIILTEEEMLANRTLKQNQPNFKKIPFKCDSCVLGFTVEENLNLHNEKKHHISRGRHKCPVCLTRHPTLKAMSRHQQTHYTQHKCVLCKYDSVSLMATVRHCNNKHKGDEHGLIHCRQCEDVFGSSEELNEHMKIKHLIKCEECGEKFKNKRLLRGHRNRIHLSNRKFSCEICMKTFKTQPKFESHMTTHDLPVSKTLTYCAICDTQYKNIHIYRRHFKTSENHSERVYHCKVCNKSFASKGYWRIHYNFYHLKKSPFKCEICNKIFMSRFSLKSHKQKRHGLKRTRDHICNICGKGFFIPRTLRSHKLIHSEDRTYLCSLCGDSFKQAAALFTHCKLVHRNGKRKVKK